MINLLSLLPNELKLKIYGYADPEAQRELGKVDIDTRKVALSLIKGIRISPHTDLARYPDISVWITDHYRNVEAITFGRNFFFNGAFSIEEAPYLEALITHLESPSENLFLSSVKKIEFIEITGQTSNDSDKMRLKDLNRHFLNAIAHAGLQSVIIRGNAFRSNLTGAEIQPLLSHFPNLKTFVFDCFNPNDEIFLSFENLPQLSKVKLLDWNGSVSSLESLIHCEKLKELVIRTSVNSSKITTALSKSLKPWNIEHLELQGKIQIENGEELKALTEQLPHLEILNIRLGTAITDEGMRWIGKNCPKLKALQLSHSSLTDSHLNKLTQHLPNLELISLSNAFEITQAGITTVAENCKNLRCIKLLHFKKIDKAGMEALANNCENLRVIDLSFGQVSLEGLHHLAEQSPNLSYVGLNHVKDEDEKEIKNFHFNFPQIKKPSFLGLKKIHKLIMSLQTHSS